jgi:hypothetical protein
MRLTRIHEALMRLYADITSMYGVYDMISAAYIFRLCYGFGLFVLKYDRV